MLRTKNLCRVGEKTNSKKGMVITMISATLQIPVGVSRETVEFICSSFEKKLNAEIDFTVVEKKDLIGGFIAKIDGTTYDNSVKESLQRMKKHLLKK